MWDQVGKALNASMVRVLSQFASLLPGMLALIVALPLTRRDHSGATGNCQR